MHLEVKTYQMLVRHNHVYPIGFNFVKSAVICACVFLSLPWMCMLVSKEHSGAPETQSPAMRLEVSKQLYLLSHLASLLLAFMAQIIVKGKFLCLWVERVKDLV